MKHLIEYYIGLSLKKMLMIMHINAIIIIVLYFKNTFSSVRIIFLHHINWNWKSVMQVVYSWFICDSQSLVCYDYGICRNMMLKIYQHFSFLAGSTHEQNFQKFGATGVICQIIESMFRDTSRNIMLEW